MEPKTLSVPQAGRLLGVSRASAYKAARMASCRSSASANAT